jgi:hypothetical protein
MVRWFGHASVGDEPRPMRHDLALDATGTVSEYEFRNSPDDLTKLVEDETDTRMPAG